MRTFFIYILVLFLVTIGLACYAYWITEPLNQWQTWVCFVFTVVLITTPVFGWWYEYLDKLFNKE